MFFKIFRSIWIEFDADLQNHGTDTEFQEQRPLWFGNQIPFVFIFYFLIFKEHTSILKNMQLLRSRYVQKQTSIPSKMLNLKTLTLLKHEKTKT